MSVTTTTTSANLLMLASLALEQRNIPVSTYNVDLCLHYGQPSLEVTFTTEELIPILLLVSEDLNYDYKNKKYYLYVPVGLYLEY